MNENFSPKDKRNLRLAEKAKERGDMATALKYYLRAAEAGMVQGMLGCASIYFEGGEGVEENIDEAFRWFEHAAARGSVTAMNNIGFLYVTLERQDEGIIWYEQAAKFGDVVAMLNLANTYSTHYHDNKMAQRWLKKAEKLTDTWSIRKVAEYYFLEEIGENYIDKAVKLYEKAIELGDAEAFKELGDMYFELDDFDSAQRIYRAGAAAGNVACMANMGMFLVYAPDSFPEAHYWLSRAVEGGSTFAIKILGDLYKEHGNYPKALRCYRKAVMRGVEEAENDLVKAKRTIRKHKANYKLRLRST